MDQNRKILVDLLTLAINEQKFQGIINKNIDWNAVYEEAVVHQIHTLIFHMINQIDPYYGPNIHLILRWQTEALISAALQLQHIQQISEVLQGLNNEGIPIIALKGLIIREYYPQPDLRTMGDADILVHKDDIDRVKRLLTKTGYELGPTTSKHISFYHKFYPPIEVHWTLVDPMIFPGTEYFTDLAWTNAVETHIYDTQVLALSLEDQILHLLLHMAGHFIRLGFGLRQLCDFNLFTKSNYESINWIKINEYGSSYRILRFTCAIFATCNRMFQLEIPSVFNSHITEIDSYIDLLIIDIFDSGVFGNRMYERGFNVSLMHYIDDKASVNITKKFSWIISVIFPLPKKLGSKYRYAFKYPILLPIAWIDRIVHNIFRKHVTTYLKNISKTDENSSFEVRLKLLRWLELR